MKLTQLNELPMPAWSWLKINTAELESDADIDTAFHPHVQCLNTDKLLLTEKAGNAAANLPADAKRVQDFVSAYHNYELTVTIPKDMRLDKPMYLNFLLDETSPVLIDHLRIEAEEDSQADIVVTYRAEGNSACFHSSFTSVEIAPGASVHLYKIQMLGNKDTHLDATVVSVAEAAEGNVFFCELGGQQVISGCSLALTGAESQGSLNSLYLGSGNRTQDFNYRLELGAPASKGDIIVKGALAGSSKKILKSTLDFLKGASGSKGTENETVLTLSDHAVNLSAPLLLCGEDNVEGEHATSTGKPDEAKLYYLMCRGFSEKEARHLLVEASFSSILDQMPSDDLRSDILSRIEEVVHDEH